MDGCHTMGIMGGSTEREGSCHQVQPVDEPEHDDHHLSITECNQEIVPGFLPERFGHPAMDTQPRKKTGMGNSILEIL